MSEPKLFKRTGSSELQLVSEPRRKSIDTMMTSPIGHRSRSARSVAENENSFGWETCGERHSQS